MEFIRKVCKIGGGEHCCRYLTFKSNKYFCAKNIAEEKLVLDARAQVKSIKNIADNCDGFDPDVNLANVSITVKA